MGPKTIYERFKEMFPDMEKDARSYKRIGGKAITITFGDCSSLIFMYYGPDNWNLGTKYWRSKPENSRKKGEKND